MNQCYLSATVIFLFVFFSCTQPEPSRNNDTSSTELEGLKVPDGFSLERVTAPGLVDYPMFATFDEEGRLFVFESDGSTPSTEDMKKDPVYFIRLLEDTNRDGTFDSGKIFADSLTYPKGGVFYRGSLYVSSAPDFLKLTDTDNDGVADKKEVILTGWVLNHNGALLGGPFFGPDGWMYLTDARRGFDITTKEGRRMKGSSARIWRCKPDGSQLESYCGGGYDNAIELAFMPSGETVGTMTYFTDPQGGFRDALMHWVEGGVYPKPLDVIEADRYQLTGDLMPVMSKTARVAPSGIMRYRSTSFGKDFTGNLFSAEFNTGRIMRHRVHADGATYRTDDEPFITSTIPDIHLTDVVEDADGSLLVVNTGGWFIAGCPLSRVAKTNVKGAIYRVRKNGTEATNNWPTKKELNALTPEKAARAFIDAQPLYRDALIEKLVESGSAGTTAIKNKLLTSPDAEIRTAAVFALYRINTSEAMKEVRQALSDQSAIVRTAAARCAGLAKDTASIMRLMQLVKEDELPVRRQAATALGQIPDNRTSFGLAAAAEGNKDRYLEHAIIYSLIRLNNPSSLIRQLQHSSAEVKKSAIIALDQVFQSPMQQHHIAPLLMSSDTTLSNTAAWIIGRRRAWPDLALQFINYRLSNNVIMTNADMLVVKKLLISFSGEEHVQRYLASQLSNEKYKTLITEVISKSPVSVMPAAWVKQLGSMLRNKNPEIYSQALQVIESRSISELNSELNRIISDKSVPEVYRLKALSIRIVSEPRLTSIEFSVTMQFLSEKYSSPIRQQAARILASARLSNSQLTTIAEKYIRNTEIYLLSSLLMAFEGNNDPKTGGALVASLSASTDKLQNIGAEEISRIINQYPQDVRAGAAQLLQKLKEKNAERLTHLTNVEAGLRNGDVGRGREIFFGKGQCSTCHSISNEGGIFGPDLTNLGEIRSQHDILEAILYPGASFAREYETSKIETSSTTYTGIIKEQFPDYILLSAAPGQELRIQQSDIKTIAPHNMSLMPPGLEKQLSPAELSDLMSYLTSLPDGMGGEGEK